MNAIIKKRKSPAVATTKKASRSYREAAKTLRLRPHLSEKAYALSEERNTYIFIVPSGSSRHDVADAVALQFEVTVNSVRTAHQPRKNRRSYQRRGRIVHRGQTSPAKKAYVTLAQGSKLPIFAAVEDGNKAEKETK